MRSKVGHETESEDTNLTMTPNIRKGIVPEATLNRKQNLSTGQSIVDTYDYIV